MNKKYEYNEVLNIYADLVYFFNVSPEYIDELSVGEVRYMLSRFKELEEEYNILAGKIKVKDKKSVTITADNPEALAAIAEKYNNPFKQLRNNNPDNK